MVRDVNNLFRYDLKEINYTKLLTSIFGEELNRYLPFIDTEKKKD